MLENGKLPNRGKKYANDVVLDGNGLTDKLYNLFAENQLYCEDYKKVVQLFEKKTKFASEELMRSHIESIKRTEKIMARIHAVTNSIRFVEQISQCVIVVGAIGYALVGKDMWDRETKRKAITILCVVLIAIEEKKRRA